MTLLQQTEQKTSFEVLKKTLLYFSIPFLILSLFLFSLYANEVKEERKIKETEQRLQLALMAREITGQFTHLETGLKILASHHELATWLESGEASHLEALATEFLSFVLLTEEYDQIRLIDVDGGELIRVDMVDGNPLLVSPETLQDKHALSEFERILSRNTAQIFLSIFTLNTEVGKMVRPAKPTLKIGMSLTDSAGQTQALLVIRYRGTAFLQYLKDHLPNLSETFLFVGSDDFWFENVRDQGWRLVYPDEGKEDFEKRFFPISKRNPVLDSERGQFYSAQGLTTFLKFPLSQKLEKGRTDNQNLPWIIGTLVPKKVLYAQSTRILLRLLFILAFLSLCVGGGAYVVASKKVRHENAEKALDLSEERHRRLVNTSPYGILEFSTEGEILFGSTSYHELLGYEDMALIGIDVRDLVPEDEKPQMLMADVERLVGEQSLPKSYTHQMIKQDGDVIDIEMAWNYHRNEAGKVIAFVSVITDITERKKSEAAQRLSISVFENAIEGMTITDPVGMILSVNAAFTKITGFSAEDVIGKNPRILQSGRHDKDFYNVMWNAIKTEGHWQGEVWNRKKNGEIFPEFLSVVAVKDNTGEVTHYIGLFSDITQRKADEKKLYTQAYYDPLTGLPNRILLMERLSQAIKGVRRNKRKAALLFIDLDHFKQINDTLGHDIGDVSLKSVSDRLLTCVRETDTVARSGGDEFLIVLPDIGEKKEAAFVARKIIRMLSKPFQLKGHEAFLGASIGITMVPDDGDEMTALLKNGDMAMYKAKSRGRSTYSFFSEKMEKAANERALLEWDLKRALDQGEMDVYYQPIVDLESLKTISVEALIRWRHPSRGLLGPDRFIPLAEESGMIGEIGQWVLETACNQMQQWRTRYGISTGLSVNVSSRQLIYDDFGAVIARTLETSGLPAESLTLEITEGLMLDAVESSIKRLHALKEIGVQIAIDDFGTGYSSLSYLSKYPIDFLKIDKSFIKNVFSDPQKKPLVKTIVRMGRTMKLKVIAEGVETQEDLQYLQWLHCHEAQGYYFSKPKSSEDYEAVLEKAGVT